jgi:hypothetical protein
LISLRTFAHVQCIAIEFTTACKIPEAKELHQTHLVSINPPPGARLIEVSIELALLHGTVL